jgi:hypothetical protein
VCAKLAPQPCIRLDLPEVRTMKQPYASVASPEAAGPFSCRRPSHAVTRVATTSDRHQRPFAQFLRFQKDSALAQWYRTRTEGPNGARKTTMIVALARKLLIAMWRLVTTGEIPDGVRMRVIGQRR